MRRLRYGVAMSLDGYIAGPKGEADWIVMDPEIDFAAIWSEHDTLLMGRRTYDGMRAMGRGGGGGPFAGMKIVVVSRTLVPREHPKVTIVSGELEETVAALKKEPGKDIWLFGGGELFRSLLALGLVDTVEVAVVPVLLGEGIPLLPAPGGKAKLTLAKHRIYAKTGTVQLIYDVSRGRRRKGR
jgi:dihydrofolate reductase